MNRILIDTNIYSHALRGFPDVVTKLKSTDEIAICAISIGELLSGFKGGEREKENRRELGVFLDSARVRVFTIDDETSEFYAEIVQNLKKEGHPIPTNDIWIGSVAMQHGLKIYSKDKHFKFIPGLICVE